MTTSEPPITPGSIPGPPEPTPSTDRTQLYGILGIVLAVVCCAPLGILFGWMSMNEAKKSGKDETLGKVGFWLGIALTAVGVISLLIVVCAGGFGALTGDVSN